MDNFSHMPRHLVEQGIPIHTRWALKSTILEIYIQQEILLSAVGWTDFYVAKMDFTGNLIHAFSIGSVDNQMLNGFEFDQTGNLVLYGYFNSTVDFDPGPGVFNLVAGSGTAMWFYCKI